MSKMTREMLNARRIQAKMAADAHTRTVLICAGTGCIAGGSLKIYDYLKTECEKRGISVLVNLMDDETQCAGHAINRRGVRANILIQKSFYADFGADTLCFGRYVRKDPDNVSIVIEPEGNNDITAIALFCSHEHIAQAGIFFESSGNSKSFQIAVDIREGRGSR